MLFSAAFILSTFLLSAPNQATASEVEPTENSRPKLTAYHVGHLMLNVPESMEMRRSITLLPWILKNGIETQIRFSEKKFCDIEAGERELLADFQDAFNRLNKSGPGEVYQSHEEEVEGVFDFPAKMFSTKTYYPKCPDKCELTDPKYLHFSLFLKLHDGYLDFHEMFFEPEIKMTLDDEFKATTMQDFFTAIKIYLTAYKWTGSEKASGPQAFKTQFGEINVGHNINTPGFTISFRDERKTAELYVSSSDIFFGDRVKGLARIGLMHLSQDYIEHQRLPFIMFRPRTVAGFEGYELMVFNIFNDDTNYKQSNITIEWAESKRPESKAPQLSFRLHAFTFKKETLANLPKLLEIWNAVLDNAQVVE